MGYCNKLIEPSKPPLHPPKLFGYKIRKFVMRVKDSFQRMIVHIKLILRRHGYAVYISCKEMVAARMDKPPERVDLER